ncbi:hypothetical protein BST28156_00195 [Burkholderia stagnalis]|nr:hypothetical protein BST28156_00195 [Burkholderia stagnalis]
MTEGSGAAKVAAGVTGATGGVWATVGAQTAASVLATAGATGLATAVVVAGATTSTGMVDVCVKEAMDVGAFAAVVAGACGCAAAPGIAVARAAGAGVAIDQEGAKVDAGA